MLKINEDLKIKITLILFVFSVARLAFFFYDSPTVVGDFPRDNAGMIKDAVSVYDLIVAEPISDKIPASVEVADKKSPESPSTEKSPGPNHQTDTAEKNSPKVEVVPPSEPSKTIENTSPQQEATEELSTAEMESPNPDTEVDSVNAENDGPTNEELAPVQDEESPPEVSIQDPEPPVKVQISPELKMKVLSLMTCKQYNEGLSSINPVVWKLMVRRAGKNSYKTRSPAALPVIAKEVFGEEECWPKIWSLNPDITNPYDVPEGTELIFLQNATAGSF